MIPISDELFKKIVVALEAYIEDIDERCGETGCLCDLSGPVHSQWVRDVLIALRSAEEDYVGEDI